MQAKVFDLYRPVLCEEGRQWGRLETPVEFETQPEGDIHMRFSVNLKGRKKLFIALTYPWSVEENEQYL
jgi:hypothetical protein